VTYIGIYEDRDISVGIFIIGRGCRIPLHNHPGMHGVLKVVHGQIDVASYTKLRPEQVTSWDLFSLKIVEHMTKIKYVNARIRSVN
jgi:cysteamine dioxygenase